MTLFGPIRASTTSASRIPNSPCASRRINTEGTKAMPPAADHEAGAARRAPPARTRSRPAGAADSTADLHSTRPAGEHALLRCARTRNLVAPAIGPHGGNRGGLSRVSRCRGFAPCAGATPNGDNLASSRRGSCPLCATGSTQHRWQHSDGNQRCFVNQREEQHSSAPCVQQRTWRCANEARGSGFEHSSALVQPPAGSYES